MKNKWIFLFVIILLGCSGSPTRTAYQAEKNRMDMMDLKKNMPMERVRYLMGYPKKVEKRCADGKQYEVWYFVTKGVYLDQSRYIDDNFTPFIFYKSYLIGWGWHFYNHLFDINNARYKAKRNAEGKYIEQDSHWPDYNHKMLHPKEKKDNVLDKKLEKSIELLLNNDDDTTSPKVTKPSQAEKGDSGSETNDTSPQEPKKGGSLEIIEKPSKNNVKEKGKTSTIIEKNVKEDASKEKESSSDASKDQTTTPALKQQKIEKIKPLKDKDSEKKPKVIPEDRPNLNPKTDTDANIRTDMNASTKSKK